MLIAFVHNHKAFLPALHGYIHFFTKYDISVGVCTARELRHLKCDVEWHFMGIDRSHKKTAIKIHDYSSASTPPFAGLKNRLKVQLNTRPDYRLFPNQFVYDCFAFKDLTPFGFRDVGVDNPNYTFPINSRKEFDFIYIGEMKSRRLGELIALFTVGTLSTKTVLFLSKDYKRLSESLQRYSNIQFKGPVAPEEVKKYIQLSKFGINYIPAMQPFTQQTSTKFLEYAANKIPIITTRYAWIENFQNKHGGNYFYLNNDLSNFTWEAVNKQQYSFPDLSEWSWEYQIRKSGVLDFISSKFPGIRW